MGPGGSCSSVSRRYCLEPHDSRLDLVEAAVPEPTLDGDETVTMISASSVTRPMTSCSGGS